MNIMLSEYIKPVIFMNSKLMKKKHIISIFVFIWYKLVK